MSLNFYKVLHILGFLLVFAALGGMTLQSYLGGGDERKGRRLAGLSHGIGLLIVLVSGFGMLARLGVGFDGWVWVKMALWLVFGGVIVVIRRQPHYTGFLWFLLPILGAFAGYLALYKPF